MEKSWLTGAIKSPYCYDLGGDRYLSTGDILPDSVLDELRGYDAIFLGAIGHPDVKPGILEKGILLRLRFELDQYINLRPVKLYPGVETPIKDKGPRTSTSSWSARTPRASTAGMGGFQYEGHAPGSRDADPASTRASAPSAAMRYAFEY
jgi:3-isopropylmalate dehydrogenase